MCYLHKKKILIWQLDAFDKKVEKMIIKTTIFYEKLKSVIIDLMKYHITFWIFHGT